MENISKDQARLILAKRIARSNFRSFCYFMNYDFFKTREPHFSKIAKELDSLSKNGGRLSINTPPRFGKSTISNYFICYLLLIEFDRAILRASYSASLSQELNSQVREIIKTSKFSSLQKFDFDEIENNKTKLRFAGRHRASLYASSVGGSTTGFGGDTIISDDLYKDHTEALSDTVNNKTITWYHSAFQSRLDGEKKIELMIGTRWRTEELTDVLEKKGYFDNSIIIRALNEDGKSFNEKVKKTSELKELQSLMHPRIFNSMYQQNPMESFEELITLSDIRYLKKYNPSNFTNRIMVVDIADEGSDSTTAVVADVYDGDVVILDLLTDDNNLDIVRARLINMAVIYDPIFKIEKNNNSYFGRKICEELKEKNIRAMRFSSSQNKRNKILLNAHEIKKFKFIENQDSEYNTFIRKVCKYDLTNSNQHDDEIDVLAMLVNEIYKMRK
jgi:hypothetical protein